MAVAAFMPPARVDGARLQRLSACAAGVTSGEEKRFRHNGKAELTWQLKREWWNPGGSARGRGEWRRHGCVLPRGYLGT